MVQEGESSRKSLGIQICQSIPSDLQTVVFLKLCGLDGQQADEILSALVLGKTGTGFSVHR